jgi:hypothetical protein
MSGKPPGRHSSPDDSQEDDSEKSAIGRERPGSRLVVTIIALGVIIVVAGGTWLFVTVRPEDLLGHLLDGFARFETESKLTPSATLDLILIVLLFILALLDGIQDFVVKCVGALARLLLGFQNSSNSISNLRRGPVPSPIMWACILIFAWVISVYLVRVTNPGIASNCRTHSTAMVTTPPESNHLQSKAAC